MRRESAVPVIIADHNGIISYVNERFEVELGWSAADLVGKTLTTIIPPALHTAHNMGFSRFLTTGQPTLLAQVLNLRLVLGDGREIDAEHFIIGEKVEGQWVFAATIRPAAQG